MGGLLWYHSGAYGFNVIARRGGSYWIDVSSTDPRLSSSMRLALRQPPPNATSGPLVWREIEPGFEISQLPVMAGNHEVDRILLNRIDPGRFRFVARNAPDGDKGIDEWEHFLPNAVLIVNASYYDVKGRPDTPFLSQGIEMGPTTYDAKAGAFVARDGAATVTDLTRGDWRRAFAGASNAMVSYPLLIGNDGQTHVVSKSRWLANRTFIGEDSRGRIIIGTTEQAFFSLERLAAFLKGSPLDLKVALNLDGGPIACQSVRLKGFKRKFYARWEAQVDGEQVRLLRWPLANASWAMPMILTVERR
jgi:hypothetical protein